MSVSKGSKKHNLGKAALVNPTSYKAFEEVKNPLPIMEAQFNM